MRYILALSLSFALLTCKDAAVRGTKDYESFILTPLSKGINLDNWFTGYSDTAQYATRYNAASFRFIKSLGFTYVRITIGDKALYNADSPSQLNLRHLAALDSGVLNAIKAGLAVTIDLHTLNNTIDSLLANDLSEANKIAAYW